MQFGKAVTAFSAIMICACSTATEVKAQGAAKGSIEIRQDKREKYRFFVLNEDAKTLGMSVGAGYATEEEAKKAITQMKEIAAKKDAVQIIKDKKDRFRLYIKYKAGDAEKTLLMTAGAGYATEEEAKKMAESLASIAKSATPKLVKK